MGLKKGACCKCPYILLYALLMCANLYFARFFFEVSETAFKQV